MSAHVFQFPSRIDPARIRPEWVACIIVCLAGVVGMDGYQQLQPNTAMAHRADLHPVVRTAGDVVAPPEHVAYVDSNFPAPIQRVRVLLGANVKAGQPLADLAAPGVDRRLATAEMAYSIATQSYQTARAKPDPAVRTAREVFAYARAQEREARSQAQGVTLASDVYRPAADLQQLAYERAAAGQALWSALRARDEALSSLRENADQAKSEVVAAKRERRRWQVLAPITGTVIRMALTEGAKPSTESDDPAVTIVNLNKLEVKTQLPSGAEQAIRPGSKAKIQLGELGERTYSGVVTSIEELLGKRGSVVKQAVVQITDNSKGHAKPGMHASVAFAAPVRKRAVIIPLEAVRFDDGGRTVVRVVNRKGIEERAVTLGASDGVRHEICSGLQPGEVVELPSTRR